MTSNVTVLEQEEAYFHLSKQYVQFDLIHFNKFYDEVTQTFTFVNKQTGVMFIVRSVAVKDQPVMEWKESTPITFIPLDTIVSIHYSPDFHFMAIQRSSFLVDLYDLTNSYHTSISVRRKTGGILYNGVFFSTLRNSKEKKPSPEEQTQPVKETTGGIMSLLSFVKKPSLPVYEGWNLVIVTNFEIQCYSITHIRHIYRLLKSMTVSCTKFRYVQKLNLLFTYIRSEQNTEIQVFLLANNTILKLSSVITPRPIGQTKIMICDHYNTVHVMQYCPEDGALFITEYNDYLDSAHVFKSIKLPVRGPLTYLSSDNLILFLSSVHHAAFVVDLHQLSFIAPLSPILLEYITSSADYSYQTSSIPLPKKSTEEKKDNIITHTFTDQKLGIQFEESFQKYIDGEYRGRRYDYFDNSAFIAKCDKNIFPEGSRLLSVDTTSTNGLSFAACSDVIAKSSRPVTISVETSVPSPNDMNAYYPIQPFLKEATELTEEERSLLNIFDTDTEYMYPHYIYNKYTGTLFHLFVDLHQLSSLIPSRVLYSFLSQRTHYDPIFIKTEILNVLYRSIYKQNNYVSLIFDQINDVYQAANYIEPQSVFNPLYLNEEFNGLTHIPMENIKDSTGNIIINQSDIMSYVFDPSLYSEEQYSLLSIYITDYYRSLVDHHIKIHPFLIELLIYIYIRLNIYPQLVNLLHYMNGKDIHEGTRLLLSIDKSKVSQDIYDSLINIGLDSLKQDGKWRDICMFYIKNYMITKACSTIINHSSSFESGRQIWIRQLFDNALQICVEKNDLTVMYQLYRLLKVWSPNTLKNYTSEGGNELSHILGELNPILLTEPYHYVCTLFGLKYQKN